MHQAVQALSDWQQGARRARKPACSPGHDASLSGPLRDSCNHFVSSRSSLPFFTHAVNLCVHSVQLFTYVNKPSCTHSFFQCVDKCMCFMIMSGLRRILRAVPSTTNCQPTCPIVYQSSQAHGPFNMRSTIH